MSSDPSKTSTKLSEESIKTRKEGNKLYGSPGHNKQIHLQILALYNKSAALAEDGSEEMALAISNRSALLMHLHKFKESLIDIEKSYQMTKSDELKAKLLTRKLKCLTLNDESEKNRKSKNIQQTTDVVIQKVSKTIPCAADCVSIEYDKDWGRYIVATKDIEIGTIIAKEKAIVLNPNLGKTFIHCSHCLLLAYNGIPCSSCSSIIFCSEKCKQEACLQYHDVECSFLHSIIKNEFCDNLILAFRFIIKFIRKEGLENIMHDTEKMKTNTSTDELLNRFFEHGVFQSNKFQSFINLSHNKEENLLEKGNRLFIPVIKSILEVLVLHTKFIPKMELSSDDNKVVAITSKRLLKFLEEIVYKFKRIIDQNAYAFQEDLAFHEDLQSIELDPGKNRIGTIITPFCSLFNHSCDQNTWISCTKNQEIVICAVKLIKKGEQIFTNYGTLIEMEKKLRQEKLKTYYNFTCKCEPCISNWPTDFSEPVNGVSGEEVLLKFKRSNITDSAIKVFFGVYEDAFNKKTYKEVIKMCHIIQKNYTSDKASIFLTRIKKYLCVYQDMLFNVKLVDIPNSC